MKSLNLNPVTKHAKAFIGLLSLLFIGVVVSSVTGWNPIVVASILFVASMFQSHNEGALNELVISDTSYSGTYASYFWVPATFGLQTIQKGLVYVQDGIKKKHTIDRINFANPLQPRQATPTSAGSFTIDGRALNPQDMMLYTEFNPRDFEANFLAEQLSRTLLARELPVTAENYMMQMALNRTFEQIETGIWIGSTQYQASGSAPAAPGTANYQLQFFDGFINKMVSDSAVNQISAPVTLTTSNILDKMNACIEKMTQVKKAIVSRANKYERLKFAVSPLTEELYTSALTTGLTFKGNMTNEGGTKPWRGYDVVAVAGMPDNTILFCESIADTSSNLYVGMNSMEDNNLQLMRLQNNSELFFLKGLMKYDVQYGFSDEVVLYTTLTPSDFGN